MTTGGLKGYFEAYIDRDSIFKNKKVLQSNFKPDVIHHRDAQIKQIASVLAPALKLDKTSNLFIYGKTGTGKTLTVQHTTQEISAIAKDRNLPIKIVYLNCKLKKVVDTEYRIIAQLAREFGKEIPPTGLPTDEVYKIFYSAIEQKEQVVILILDEIDQLVRKIGDEVLYNLTRINTDLAKSQISVIGISNDLSFTDDLDPRIKSSLSEEEFVFPPYNALQIQSILRQRAKDAFHENALEEGLIEKCAAFAARDHGDARRALELLRVSGELAERNGEEKVMIKHLDEAEDKIERDRITDVVSTQPKQHQAIFYAIMSLYENRKDTLITGEVYELYRKICDKVGFRPLTQRRVSDVIAELDMLGLINVKVISKGRYGRTREISLISENMNKKIKKILEESLEL
jgi:archaeal cell division control protein 6